MGGRERSTKKYSRKGKLKEKNSCTPINPKKYSCYGLKKIHIWNLITGKISCGSKIPLPSLPPPPTHNFSNGCPLDPCTTMVEVKVQITASLKLSFRNCTSCVFWCDVISFIAQFKYMKFIYSTFHNASHLILWEVCESIWAWSQSEIFGLN